MSPVRSRSPAPCFLNPRNNLLGGLKLHVLVHEKLCRRVRSVISRTGSNDAKSIGTQFDGVTIRRALPGYRNVIRRDQIVERGIFPFADKVPALRRSDADQIAFYARDVNRTLRCI